MVGDERPKNHEFEKVLLWLRELRSHGFYGTIAIGMQNGEICSLKPEASCKPGEPLPVFKRREKTV